MKRFLIAAAAILLLPGAVFIVFFTASSFRVEGRPYARSLSDFVFMVGSYNAQALGLDPPSLTDRNYERVMLHANPKVHREVEERIVWSLTRWGEEVAPRLINELETFKTPDRVQVAATALGHLQYRAAIPSLKEAFERASSKRHLQIGLIDALAEIGPEAAPFLIETYRRSLAKGEVPQYNLLDAIGRSGGGAEFLIAEMERAASVEQILELEWPLAFTRDPRAARVLVDLLHHPRLAVRRRARDSMAQSMGTAAIEPAVDLLENETDDFVRSGVIERILAGRSASESTRAVELLGKLLEDPVVGRDANYALARIASDDAIGHLRRSARDQPARWVMDNLEYTGVVALRVLEDYLHHPEPMIRRLAINKIIELEEPEALTVLRSIKDEPDGTARALLERAVFQHDLLLLEESFRGWLSEKTGRTVGRLRLPGRKGIRVALSTLGFLNWAGWGISIVLGILLLSGGLRAFESYKFALTIQFLLVSGIVGDFFFMSSGPAVYRWATAGRLLLLLGLLFLRDDPLPGETQGRIERLTVRSLWILVPTLLLFATPLFSEAFRQALRDFQIMKWALLLLALLTLLLFEQALLPWDFLARGSRAERALTFCLSSAVTMLFALPVWLWMNEQSAAGNEDRAVLGGLFLLPLLVALIFHIHALRRGKPTGAFRHLPPPPRGIRVFFDGESLLIRLQRKRAFRGLPHFLFGTALLGVSWWLCHSLEVTGGGAAGLVLLMMIAVFGTVLTWLLFAGLSPTFCIQLRDGAARSATTFLGAAFGPPVWHRRLRFGVLSSQLRLGSKERRWLSLVLKEQRVVPHIELTLAKSDVAEDESSMRMDLLVRNVGQIPARLADFEERSGTPWTAEVDGHRADVFFTLAEREALVQPGATRTYHPRVFPRGNGSGLDIVLRCGTEGPRARARFGGTGP
jgi:HEAT repeat protein